MDNWDGVIFAIPNYSSQVTALMQNFLDRLGFVLHLSLFFLIRLFMVIVTQGIYGGTAIVKYLETIRGKLGFHVSKGYCLTALQPISEIEQRKIAQEIKNGFREILQGTYAYHAADSFFYLTNGISDYSYNDKDDSG